MTFSDDDLKRLKYHKAHSHRISEDLIDRLLARLEAAEKCLSMADCDEVYNDAYNEAYNAWRKAANRDD